MQREAPQPSSPLGQHGLTEEIIRAAVIRGEIARASCTRLDPVTRAGYSAWAETTKALREELVIHGWKAQQGGTHPTVSPTGKLEIIVQTGDDATGRPEEPRSRNPKGPVIERVVAANQLLLWQDVDVATALPVAETWVLLIARDDDEVRFELSLPNHVDADGRIDGWKMRIRFDPLDDTDPPGDRRPSEDTGEIDIDVTKRKQA